MPPTDQLDQPRARHQSQPAAHAPALPQPAPARAPKRRSILPWIILAALVVGAGWYISTHKPAETGPSGRAAFQGPVPITPGVVKQQDVPIYLTGIGTVQAFNTVTVHSRVDGQLIKIAFTEGQDVKEGDVLAQIDPAPFQTALDQAVGKKGQDAAQYANSQLDLQRDTDMLAKKVISSQQYDTQKALVDQLKATVAADEAAIASAKVQLDYTTVRAPLGGRVGIRQIDEGNIIHAADTNGLVVITQLQPISVLFTLPEQNLKAIHQQSADGSGLPVISVDRDDNSILDSGTVAVVNNQIDPTTGTIQIKATFGNPKYQLWPGQFVNARLLLTTRKNGITVPAQVVQNGPDGAFVYMIKPDQTVDVQKVKVAQIDNNVALIDDGLKPGDNVVVDGQYKLQPGSKVRLPGQNGPGQGGAGGHGGAGGGQGGGAGQHHHQGGGGQGGGNAGGGAGA